MLIRYRALLLATPLIGSCGRLFGGTEVVRLPLRADPQGGYARLRLALCRR